MDPLGVAVIVAVLLVATTFGLWRRRTDGIIRDETEDRKRRADILAAAGLEVVELPDHSPAATATAAAKAASTAAAVALQGTHEVHAPSRPLAAVADPIADKSDMSSGAMVGVVPDKSEEPGVVEDPSAAGAQLAPGLLERFGIGPAEVTLLQFSSAF